MGQLEKYGLYVLCLVIFLILGVTIWGGGDVPAGRSPAAPIRAPQVTPSANLGGTGPGRSLAETLLGAGSPEAVRASGQPSDGPVSRKDLGSREATVDKVTPPSPNDPPKDGPKAAVAVAPTQVAYKVQEGDTYGSLARTKLGKESLWIEIQRLNPTIKPEKLRPGTEILLPTAASLASADAPRGKSVDKVIAPAPDGSRVYTVKKGDHFERIAQVELGSRKRTEELMAFNPGVAPEKLKPGMTLKLPKK